MPNPFSAPAPAASSFDLKAALGHLLVVEPLEYVASITTSLGEKDAVRATVHDITAGTTTEDVLLFPRVLVSSLRSRIGEKVLATLAQGQAKPGQSAPWILEDASEDGGAVNDATAYLTGLTAATLTSPTTAAAAPTTVEMTPELAAALANLQGSAAPF